MFLILLFVTTNEGTQSYYTYNYSTFGNALTTIGNDAFDGCSRLRNVTFPEGLDSIGIFAFRS